MKSALFESINDRNNIANAYLKMIGESAEEDDLSHAFEGVQYPLTLLDENDDSVVVDLYDIAKDYKDPSYYEKGSDDYYVSFALYELGEDDVYKKLLEEEPEYRQSEQDILRAGCTYNKDDVINSIVQIGREIESDLHNDDIEVQIPEWAVTYYEYGDDSGLTEEDKKLADDYMNGIESRGYTLSYDGENLGFCSNPEFGLASDCVKYYLVKTDGSFNESTETDSLDVDGWFDSLGVLVKDIPEECIIQCTQPGHDAYEDCKEWVRRLGFDKGLDMNLARGYLKWTGGWTGDEITAFSPEEVAIRLLWILCGDIKEGVYGNPDDVGGGEGIVSIGDAKGYWEESIGESKDLHEVQVILTGIEWPSKGGDRLPKRDSKTVKVADGEDIKEVIKAEYIDSFGIAPKKFNIAKKIDVGVPKQKNEMISQKELDNLKKKNPKLKDISETK